MRKTFKPLLGIGYNQFINVVKLIHGEPINYPSFSSMTLDKDDVIVAKKWLRNKKTWYDCNTVEEYEKKFALWNGSKHAFAFMGGRIALSACIYALGLKEGDEVILPGYTCVVVPNAFHFAGIKTIYCDIELDTYGLDASQLECKITPKTKAVLLHHLYGLVCRDYEIILEIANKYGLKVIEDCAHSTGAEYKGKKVGNFGDTSFYSSEQSKIFTTIQGGMAVTNDDKIAEKMKKYYNNAMFPDDEWIDKQLHNVIYNYYAYKHRKRWFLGDFMKLLYKKKLLISTTKEEECGIKPTYYGKRMPSPIASIGLNQLEKIDYYNEQRRYIAKKWDKWCEKNGYKKPMVIPYSIPVYLRYPIIVEEEKKQDTSWALRELGVQVGIWFVSNIHPSAWPVTGCINADKSVKQCVNFPCLLS